MYIGYLTVKNYIKMAWNAISDELKFKIFPGACPRSP